MESVQAVRYQAAEMSKNTIRKCAADLEVALIGVKLTQEKDEIITSKLADIDGCMLCEEIEALKPILPLGNSKFH
ncbi:hypothetical protein AVEN_30783-1 [Araneus ventricosus]|uniref:Uncharacterized protein n=1 Tax=Araneus ventricosus TaxID=182803 RepID=A0A4Y2QPV5_ARAVE|nr:hypothetical protein AVEN_144864-1 [Araneus ventricosus]GBN65316.1 hypothetical protein AVEN_30783-1 [Araneus ventricosus]